MATLGKARLSGFESQLSSFTNHYSKSATLLLTEYSTIRNRSCKIIVLA